MASQTAISLSLLGGASAPRQLILTWSRPAFLGDCAQDFADMEAKVFGPPSARVCRIVSHPATRARQAPQRGKIKAQKAERLHQQVYDCGPAQDGQEPSRTQNQALRLGEVALTSCSGSPKVSRAAVGRCATATSTLPSA
jgi:hypothetical protein